MSVRRDPETGQFMSTGDGMAYHDMTIASGSMQSEVPASDLSGGTTTEQGQADAETILFDFDQILANDEVAELVLMHFVANCVPHTTFSAETWVRFTGGIRTENLWDQVDSDPWALDPPFTSSTEGEHGLVNLRQADGEERETLWSWAMESSGQYADSTNGLGGGGSYLHQRDIVPFKQIFGRGPVYDADDELFAPHEFTIDKVSDGAVTGNVWARFWLQIHQLD